MAIYLPAGYNFELTSWENDGDNYNTQRWVTSDREEAIRFADLIRTAWQNASVVLNLYEPGEDEISQMVAAMKPWFEKHSDWFEQVMADNNEDIESLTDQDYFEYLLMYFSHFGLAECSEFAVRSIESWSVFYLEQPIELVDIKDELV